MRKHVLAWLIIVPLLVVAIHAAGQQAAKTPAGAAKAAAATPATGPAQGPRPEQFIGKFPPLDFKPPKPSDFRHVLSNGLVVYIAEDHEIPWIDAAAGSVIVVAPSAIARATAVCRRLSKAFHLARRRRSSSTG